MKESLIRALLEATLLAFRKEAQLNRLDNLAGLITQMLILIGYPTPLREGESS